jgi:hypothetical protein
MLEVSPCFRKARVKRSHNYRYNAAGQLVEMDDWTENTAIARDALGRITEVNACNRTMYSFTKHYAAGLATGGVAFSLGAPSPMGVFFLFSVRTFLV